MENSWFLFSLPPDPHKVAWVQGQRVFIDGANCSLTLLEPEPSPNQLLMRGALGVGGRLG